jgi:hypothetical protein
MNKVLMLVCAIAIGLGLSVSNAEAARLGGGKSAGMQRQSIAPKPAQQATPAAPASAPAAAPATAPKRNWMGPLAGLAAGLGIAALLSHFGMGEGMANILMIGLLVMAAVFVFKMLFRKGTPAAQPADPIRYAGAGGPSMTPAPQAAPQFGSAAPTPLPPAQRIPAGFDTEGFLRGSSTSFACKPPMMRRISTTSGNSLVRNCLPKSRCNWTNAATRHSRPIS